MQNEKHCSPENLSRNNKWQLYCAWQSPGQLSVHRAAFSDLYSMNLSADISLSLLGLQLVVYLQGRCPRICNVCSSITEMRVWLSLVAKVSSSGSKEMVALCARGGKQEVQAGGRELQSRSENIWLKLKCLKWSASWWLLSFAYCDNPKCVVLWKHQARRSRHRDWNAGRLNSASLWSQLLRLDGF